MEPLPGGRKRWYVFGITFVALFGVLLWIALTAYTAPFRFLDGERPVPIEGDIPKSLRLDPIRTTLYSFRADFDTVAKKARAELIPLGFTPTIDGLIGPTGQTLDWGSIKWEKQFSPDSLTIHKNSRAKDILAGGSYGGKQSHGWVSVTLNLEPTPTLVDRIKSFLRL